MQVSGKLHALAALTPRKNPSTRLVGGWVRPRDGMDSFGEDKISSYFWDSDPGQSVP